MLGSPGDERRVKVHVYGVFINSLGNDECTIQWDDPTLPNANHFYHRSVLGYICRVKRKRRHDVVLVVSISDEV